MNDEMTYAANGPMSFDDFIRKAHIVHGGTFQYDKESYTNAGGQVKILCNLHGTYSMVGSMHLQGQKCRKCSIAERLKRSHDKRSNLFINKAKLIHGDLYDYSQVKYINNRTKVRIRCKLHDEYFEQSPDSHTSGHGCPVCAGNLKLDTAKFIEKAIKIHGNKYNYDKVVYVNTYSKIIVTCPHHGDWTTTPNWVLSGNGCRACGLISTISSNKYNTSIFIEKAISVHGNLYDYSNVNYISHDIKVKILCRKHGRIFEQTPANHLFGVGCPICKQSKGELQIFKYLVKYGYDFTPQYKFPDCRSIYPLPFDFGVNINGVIKCIEFHGGQHYRPVNRFGGKKAFDSLVVRDSIKKKYCEDNLVPLLVIKYDQINNVDMLLDAFLVDALTST